MICRGQDCYGHCPGECRRVLGLLRRVRHQVKLAKAWPVSSESA